MSERIDPAGLRVQQRGIEVGLPRLLLFGPPVVVDGKQDGAVLPAGRTQIKRRFPAITPNLKARPPAPGQQRGIVETPSFGFIEKALDIANEIRIDMHGFVWIVLIV